MRDRSSSPSPPDRMQGLSSQGTDTSRSLADASQTRAPTCSTRPAAGCQERWPPATWPTLASAPASGDPSFAQFCSQGPSQQREQQEQQQQPLRLSPWTCGPPPRAQVAWPRRASYVYPAPRSLAPRLLRLQRADPVSTSDTHLLESHTLMPQA